MQYGRAGILRMHVNGLFSIKRDRVFTFTRYNMLLSTRAIGPRDSMLNGWVGLIKYGWWRFIESSPSLG